ncbi:MAG: DUF3224 domain-containing protein [Thaumarchaeota archaeon]|nr:DUF3224 domain-containing protein [Nitrososphaerota archaeon]
MESKSISKPVKKSAISETATLVLATTLISLSATWAMMISSFKTPLKRLKENSSARIIFTMVIASILVVASIATLVPTALSDDDGKKIRATGEYTCPLATTTDETVIGGLTVRTQHLVCTYTGDLDGKLACLLSPSVIDDAVHHRGFVTAQCTFFGTLNGSDLGIFTQHSTYTFDRSALPAIVFDHLRFNLVEGSGLMAFEGICGSGTAQDQPGPLFTYDYMLRFGKDCKAND